MPYKKRMSGNCHQKHPEIVRVSGKCPENCNIPDVVIQKNVQKMSRRVHWFRPSVQKVSGILQFSRHFPDTRTISGHSFFIGMNFCY